VPGEADLYCAKYLSQYGGIVLTGDSDLLVHDLGQDGAVSFFKEIEHSAISDTLSSQIYQPAAISQRLDLPISHGLHAFAFEILMDSHSTFRKLLVGARSLKAVTANPSDFKLFLKEYKQLRAPLNSNDSPKILPILRSLDPRISEYVLQYPYLAQIAGKEEIAEVSETVHVFLPFLLDCPVRTNAWEVSTVIRQLAYGLINLIVPDTQQKVTVSEHRKQQDMSTGRELPAMPLRFCILSSNKTFLGSLDLKSGPPLHYIKISSIHTRTANHNLANLWYSSLQSWEISPI
jgi:hypothetical protein